MLCCDDKGTKFVRKISPSEDYNARLQTQFKKQRNFVSSFGAKTPKVINSGFLDDLFYFDMEYVTGQLMSDCINLVEIGSLIPYFEIINKHFENSNQSKSDLTIPILEKTKDLREILPKKYENYTRIIEDANWEGMPTGYCHGDFTLENMIVSNGELYFIDFLDSFSDTVLVDISKLLFDVRYFWSSRHIKRRALVKNIFVENYLTEKSLYKTYHDQINCLVILNTLRILPYAKNKKVANYLEDCLKHATR